MKMHRKASTVVFLRRGMGMMGLEPKGDNSTLNIEL